MKLALLIFQQICGQYILSSALKDGLLLSNETIGYHVHLMETVLDLTEFIRSAFQ